MLISVFLPLFNFIFIAFFGRFIGKMGTIYITLYSMGLTLILNIVWFWTLITQQTTAHIVLGHWIHIKEIDIYWDFHFDAISISMLLMISIISIIVHIYSFSYMQIDPHFNRFMSYLSLFTFFMFILVTAGNFIQLFLGWEGVGICSYLLINFWFTRVQANKAAIKAMLMNRFGDIGFLIGVTLLFSVFKSFDFITLSYMFDHTLIHQMYWIYWGGFAIETLDVICFCFLIGVIGKSAQLGLHTWLPDAMEGPTPVSALIHAATMVTAGIFFLIRCSFLFDLSSHIQNLIVILGALTALFSALTAIFIYDIKKIIAYSTCSQLGYMLVACGLSEYHIGFFHLINHAFFKALLFLTAGIVIHSFNNEQDIRKIFGLYTRLPFIHSAFLIGTVAILGLPFLSGFYSKDVILELTYNDGFNIANSTVLNFNLLFVIMLLATFFTGLYSFRLYYYLFLRQGVLHSGEWYKTNYVQPFFIQFSVSVLMLASIFGGYYLSDLYTFSNNFIHIGGPATCSHYEGAGAEIELDLLPWYIKLAPLFCNLVAILGGLLFIQVYQKEIIPSLTAIWLAFVSEGQRQLFKKAVKYADFYIWFFFEFNTRVDQILHIIQHNFYFNELYNYFAYLNLNYYYYGIFVNFDKGFLELVGPTGFARIYRWLTTCFTRLYKLKFSQQLFFIYHTLLFIYFSIDLFIILYS